MFVNINIQIEKLLSIEKCALCSFIHIFVSIHHTCMCVCVWYLLVDAVVLCVVNIIILKKKWVKKKFVWDMWSQTLLCFFSFFLIHICVQKNRLWSHINKFLWIRQDAFLSKYFTSVTNCLLLLLLWLLIRNFF